MEELSDKIKSILTEDETPENVVNTQNAVSPEDLLDACDFIDEFKEELFEIKGKIAGTAKETEAARTIRNRLHDESDVLTRLEAYKSHPLAGRATMVVMAGWYTLCLIVYLISFAGGRVAGVLVTLLSLVMFLGGLGALGLIFLGGLQKVAKTIFPAKVSYNAVSEYGPKNAERGKDRTFIIASSHDDLLGGYIADMQTFRKVIMIGLPISLSIFVLFCILKMAIGDDTPAKIACFMIIPFLSSTFGIFLMATHFSLHAQNARVNNGVGTSVAFACYSYFVEHPEIVPDDVKVVFASFGGENSAHGGSRAFVNSHPEFTNAKVICIGDIRSNHFSVSSGDAIRKIKADKHLIDALTASATKIETSLDVVEYKTTKEKLNCLHGFVSNAFAQSNLSSVTLYAKDYNAEESAVAREDEEKLFSLIVNALIDLMEKKNG